MCVTPCHCQPRSCPLEPGPSLMEPTQRLQFPVATENPRKTGSPRSPCRGGVDLDQGPRESLLSPLRSGSRGRDTSRAIAQGSCQHQGDHQNKPHCSGRLRASSPRPAHLAFPPRHLMGMTRVTSQFPFMGRKWLPRDWHSSIVR